MESLITWESFVLKQKHQLFPITYGSVFFLVDC